jgi:hemin uptake protein HemP
MNESDSTNRITPGGPNQDQQAASTDQPVRTISSSELFLGAREILIQHEEKTYRLQVTRNGKLILVK